MKRMERVLAVAALVSLSASFIGVMMTEAGHTYGWWIGGAAALLQLTSVITIKAVMRK